MPVTISKIITVNKADLHSKVIFSDNSVAEIRRSPKGNRYVSINGKITNLPIEKARLIDATFAFYL